jgi:hypothetical protein
MSTASINITAWQRLPIDDVRFRISLPTLPVTQPQAVVTIAVPVVVLGRVYPIHPKGVLWGSNSAIWMIKEVPECCCSVDRQLSPLLYVA